MTSYFPFAPRPRAPFRFQPVLDGATRQAEVRWNVYSNGEHRISNRWFITISTLTGTRVVTLPVVGSDDPLAVAAAYWDSTRERVVVATVAPHGVAPGAVAHLTTRGFSAAAYNGVFDCVALDATTLAFAMPADPGSATVLGTVAQEVDLASGYFASRLVYRTSASRFEVDP